MCHSTKILPAVLLGLLLSSQVDACPAHVPQPKPYAYLAGQPQQRPRLPTCQEDPSQRQCPQPRPTPMEREIQNVPASVTRTIMREVNRAISCALSDRC